MTSPDPYTFRAANALPNDGEPDLTTMTVEQIARDRGVTKRHAYSLMRRAQAAKMSGPVPANQRDLILTLLHQHGDYIRNTDHLSEAVHEAGSKLPPHDVTKVLWSLQKSQYVRFRERANGMLYAIKLTTEGKKAAIKLTTDHLFDEPLVEEAVASVALDHDPEVQTLIVDPVITEVGPDGQGEVYERVDEHITKVVESARLLQAEINDLGAGAPVTDPPTVVLPWFKGVLGGYPVIRDLRDRAIRAQKLNAAARILEEVGEDDMVLTLMTKTEFTGLESEVITLLRHFGEIE